MDLQVPEVPARLVFAGGEWSQARARVIERSAAWRRSSALMQLGWWLLAPIVFWIPPHIPWVLLVLGIGAVRALNRYREFRTLVSLHGPCPKCGTEQEFRETGRMKQPHLVHCAHCRWELRVDVPLAGAATSGPPVPFPPTNPAGRWEDDGGFRRHPPGRVNPRLELP